MTMTDDELRGLLSTVPAPGCGYMSATLRRCTRRATCISTFTCGCVQVSCTEHDAALQDFELGTTWCLTHDGYTKWSRSDALA